MRVATRCSALGSVAVLLSLGTPNPKP